ncbi:hypothetical protein LC605_24355 [Nostoc sp. CHAB 5836]|uniref:hypothetical protein n=1 Tax=Nostoc sp. CHAB 5836 TaxID=2780404 RepID=UPI001E4AE67D|nr:hypothetical protein [Nostoc sp. CHAB 5836]MCC5618160.1 hypothetical protein [Nostoc sp. CHAB 5836]
MIGAVILVLSACGQPTLGHPSKPGVKVPAELKHFYNQKLTFGSCEGYATTDADAKDFANDTFECARLEVPLDYQNPGGRTAQIALLRVPAKGKQSAPCCSTQAAPASPG